jgi:hypothetical protein
MNFEKKDISDLLTLTYPTGRAIQFCIWRKTPHDICIRIAAIRTISIIFITGKVAMKCAAVLKGPDSLLSNIRLINR